MNKKTLTILVIVLVVLAGAVTTIVLVKSNSNKKGTDVSDILSQDTVVQDTGAIVCDTLTKDTIPAVDTHRINKDTTQSRPQVPGQDTAPRKVEPQVATDPISRAIATGRPVLVDFGRGTCIPCKKMAPILAELREEYSGRVEVLVLDLDEYYDLARKVGIQMIPTQIFYDIKGNEVARHIGFMEKDSIAAQFTRMGVK